jgi:hypothetical protein
MAFSFGEEGENPHSSLAGQSEECTAVLYRQKVGWSATGNPDFEALAKRAVQ